MIIIVKGHIFWICTHAWPLYDRYCYISKRRNQEPSVSILLLYVITLIQRYSNNYSARYILVYKFLELQYSWNNSCSISMKMPKIISSQNFFPDFIVGNTWGENNFYNFLLITFTDQADNIKFPVFLWKIAVLDTSEILSFLSIITFDP